MTGLSKNRDIDWQNLFDSGLGQINHAAVIDIERPNAEIIQTRKQQKRSGWQETSSWITDMGDCMSGISTIGGRNT